MDVHEALYFYLLMVGHGFLSGLIWSALLHWPKWD